MVTLAKHHLDDLAALDQRGFKTVDYVKIESHNLYCRPDYNSIDYSDGDEFECKLFEAIRNTKDCSTFSPELLPLIVDWRSEYHLSRARHCLIRPLGIGPGARVLELGCGCGAITRYLGELGAVVTAVEGSMRRALVAAERCRDLLNVSIVADDLLRFTTEETFDWVLLIGVLEYAPVFSTEADPTTHYLTRAARFLNRQGRLVIAIENKLGLKYFNGCAEDHLGTPFTGIQNLYKTREPRTFGRLELEQIIRSSGHRYVSFLYPFPDYKLPRVILSQASLADPGIDPSDLLAGIYARDYERNVHYLFDEPMVSRQLLRNGLLEHLSNSFLVVSGDLDPFDSRSELAFIYNCNRAAEFATQTLIVRMGNSIRVIKDKLCPGWPKVAHSLEGQSFQHLTGENEFIPGPLATQHLRFQRASHAGADQIITELLPWFDTLVDRSVEGNSEGLKPTRLSELRLPGHLVDFTPFNAVKVGDRLTEIDLEWDFEGDVPLGWVVTRSLLYTLGSPGFESQPIRIASVISALAIRRGLTVSVDEIAQWLSYEREFQSVVSGTPKDPIPIDATSFRLVTLHDYANELRDELSSVKAALDQRDSEISTAFAQRAQLHNQVNELHDQVNDLRSQRAQLHDQVNDLRNELSSLRDELNSLKAVLAQRTEREAEISIALARRAAEISEIRASTSWRITAPLRHSKQLFAAALRRFTIKVG